MQEELIIRNLFGMKLAVKVIPRSSKSEVVGKMADGTLKVKVTAPPVDGEANDAVREVMANYFGVKKREVRIVKGKSGKRKVVEVQ